MRNDDRVELLARVTALEQLLETGYANWMAQMTQAQFAEFEQNFESRLRTIWPEAGLEDTAAGTDVEIVREAQAMAARFWKRVRDRERNIRHSRNERG
jgi:hypothetical protein